MSAYPIYTYPLLIRESHLDTFGHVNNAVYLQIFEEARWDFITANGYGLPMVQQTGQGPTVLEATVRFQRELRLRQHITVKSQLEFYKGKVGVVNQWIETAEGESACTARLTVALFDMRTRKLIEPTPAWRQAVGLEP